MHHKTLKHLLPQSLVLVINDNIQRRNATYLLTQSSVHKIKKYLKCLWNDIFLPLYQAFVSPPEWGWPVHGRWCSFSKSTPAWPDLQSYRAGQYVKCEFWDTPVRYAPRTLSCHSSRKMTRPEIGLEMSLTRYQSGSLGPLWQQYMNAWCSKHGHYSPALPSGDTWEDESHLTSIQGRLVGLPGPACAGWYCT